MGVGFSHYPLTLLALPDPELGFRVEYATEVFDADTIAVWVGRLQRVLEAMVADPGAAVCSIDLLDEGEHARLDEMGNRAVLGQSRAAVSIPGLFAAQVARSPEAVAVVCGRRSLTYRQLDEAANRLAHLLAGQGVGAGDVVGLLVPRSVGAITAIVGVLKTGAAYLPIDPMYPDARIAFMLTDATPKAVITTSELSARLAGHEVVIIDVDDPRIGAQPAWAPPDPGAEHIAYLIYTSGTTGTPKGVAITHGNVTQLFESMGWAGAGGRQGVEPVSFVCL